MEIEYTGGCVLIFSYLFLLYINVITLGVCFELRQLDTSDFIGCRFHGPPIAVRLYLTNSAKRKKRKPPRRPNARSVRALQYILPPYDLTQ